MHHNSNAKPRLEAHPSPDRSGSWGLLYPASGIWLAVRFSTRREAEEALQLIVRSDLA